MKHFKIIFSVFVLLFAATACMQHNKESITPVLDEGKPIVHQKTAYPVCTAPTDLSVAINYGSFTPYPAGPYSGTISWTAASPIPNSYTVTIQGSNNTTWTGTTTGNTINTGYFFYWNSLNPITYTLSVSSNCGPGVSSNPVTTTFTLCPGCNISGGIATSQVDDFDGVTLPTNGLSGTVGGRGYTYVAACTTATSASFNVSFTNGFGNIIGTPVTATRCTTSTCTYSSEYYLTYLFTTPSTASIPGSASDPCEKVTATLNLPFTLPSNSYVVFRTPSSTLGQVAIWRSHRRTTATNTIYIPGLEPSATYRIKFFSSYTPPTNITTLFGDCGSSGN